jgi:hypothetical protein
MSDAKHQNPDGIETRRGHKLHQNNAAPQRTIRKTLAVLGLALTLPTFTTPAQASEHGCVCLLCLANPAGPMAVASCVADITQLFDDLIHLHPFPECEMSGNSNAQQGYSYYDACPSGTSALASGAYAIQGTPGQEYSQVNSFFGGFGGNGGYVGENYYTGIGTGEGYNPFQMNSDSSSLFAQPTTKTCVGNQIGTTSIPVSNGDGSTYLQVGVYDNLVAMSPVSQPRYIDVFVDGQLYRRVRW